MADLETSFQDIFGDIFDEIFGDISTIAKDLTKATEINKDKIGRAITAKFNFSYYSEVLEFIEDASEEIKEFTKEEVDKCKGSLTLNNAKEIVDFIETNADIKDLVRKSGSWVKKLEELKSKLEDDVLEANDIGVAILECVTYLCQIRVKNDVIPLVHRGLYADKVREAVTVWQERSTSADKGDERFWQKELYKNKEILERLFGAKVIIVGQQFSAGGMTTEGKGEKYVDFAFENKATNNLVFVEIKKPSTPLLVATEYRGGVYPFSVELSGAITQVLTQRNQMMKSFYQKRIETKGSTFEVHQPKCYVIAGDLSTISSSDDKCRSFELSRNAVESNVIIKTFDELYSSFIAFNEANEI